MNLSPRIRADYLLLIDAPTSRQCLEALSTESGVEWCVDYQPVIAKATLELPELPTLLKSLPPFLVAARVSQILDGAIDLIAPGEDWVVAGFLDD